MGAGAGTGDVPVGARCLDCGNGLRACAAGMQWTFMRRRAGYNPYGGSELPPAGEDETMAEHD